MNAKALCEHFGVSRQWIDQLVVQQVIPRMERGRYDLLVCTRAYIRYLQSAMKDRSSIRRDGAMISGKEERARLARAQADRQELLLAKERGSIMAVSDHEAVLSDLVVNTKATVGAIGARAAGRVISETDVVKVQAIIDAEATAALTSLATLVPRLPPPCSGCAAKARSGR